MKYILIITDTDEGTSDLVIDWLINLKQKFYRINYETPIFIDYIKLENSSVHFKFTYQNLFNEKVTISSDDIKSIWYRRSNININTFDTLKSTHPKIINELNSNILNEKKTVESFLHYLMKSNFRSINNYLDNNQNKLKNLEVAKFVGFTIPSTLITNKKSELSPFLKNNNNFIITKPSTQGGPFGKNSLLNIYAEKIDKKRLSHIPETFPLSTFQEGIEKQFELRIFCLHGKKFAMAIFSQNDSQTKIDFRNYNYQKQNRTIPFILPNEISILIDKFMNKIDLNCGSIDILVKPNFDFIFLEVNPIGQFYQVTEPCNYYIDYEISKFLSK